MKITVLLDDEFIKGAMEVVNAKTKKEAIEAGLKELIQKKNREALISELGSYGLDLSLDELEEMRKNE